ncbi:MULTISPECIES: fimbrial protein [unclassified Pseudoxanthomonas]|uniref:fimbrial protein n=1 Tax=unclassified Pseudoxanthomonas TaxID=2645906 RepID=UPI0016207EA1|nr:type 1 fimbria pilin [Pseudoxanthomonas sp. OG2]MBV7474412.1 fimbrial protein [Pseudoxanthomonas sp. PXM05]
MKFPNIPLRTCRAWPLLLMFGAPALAEASCSPWGALENLSQTIPSPPTTPINLKLVPIGQVMASKELLLQGGQRIYTCRRGTVYGMTVANMTLPESGQPKVYQTPVEGVGVRIGFREIYANGWQDTRYPPFQASDLGGGEVLSSPYYAVVEFIRTDAYVGKGSVVFSYRADLPIPSRPETLIDIAGTHLRFNLTHDTYYTRCMPVVSPLEVPMGRISTLDLTRSAAPARSFTLDIDCEGAHPATPPPVRIHFQGDSPRDGWLNLDLAGRADIASGVGIALKDEDGNPLPFSPERALPLKWQDGTRQRQRYRLSATARYASEGGTPGAGRADASLTYVLDYN